MACVSVQPAIEERIFTLRGISARMAGVAGRVWRAYRSALVLGAEIALAGVSYALAVVVASETQHDGWATLELRSTIAALLLIRIATLLSARLYRRSLRYSSIADLISIVKVVAASSAAFALFARWQFSAFRIPTGVFAMDATFLLILLVALHFGMRVFKTERASWRHDGKRVIVIGAGDAGLKMLKELALDPELARTPVAVIDDNPEKWGRAIYGVPILGGVASLEAIAAEKRAEEILICVPSATSGQMRDILGACRRAEIPVRTLPSMAEIMDGKVSRRDLRSPQIEDLLEREPIPVDVNETRRIVGDKVVLVTGAGGSIGSELCRQIADAGPRLLLLLDKSENSLFYIHREVSEKLGAARVKPLLVDVVCRERVREILRNERPDVIFHAAAHKHVALLELHPHEAIRNNVFGTRNVAEAALEFGVARFVNISTDKAVNPRSYLGVSKRLTELCIQELATRNGTRFSSVRFGNVAGSTGSVLRLFWDQIQKGGPIRVTDPRATRYFMSVPEAVHLILRAAAMGRGGETFVLDMGEPVNIRELARTMILFAGKKPECEIALEFTGLKDGEKIAEDLWEKWETPACTENSRIWNVGSGVPQAPAILRRIDVMEAYLQLGDREGLIDYLKREIVPMLKQPPVSPARAAFVEWPDSPALAEAFATREVA
jgi:FlaA1/EpsC-like NDP-sugar epimerase